RPQKTDMITGGSTGKSSRLNLLAHYAGTTRMPSRGTRDNHQGAVMKTALCAMALWILTATAIRADELPRSKPEDVGLSTEKLGRVRTLVQEAVDKGQTAGAVVLITRHGNVVYLEAFGKINASTGRPMPVDAIFRIHSMTKPITTVAALRLYDEGKFKLDDP